MPPAAKKSRARGPAFFLGQAVGMENRRAVRFTGGQDAGPRVFFMAPKLGWGIRGMDS